MPDLPPPLPHGERTAGQFIAETIRAYGGNFWRALPLGIPLVAVDQLCVHQTAGVQMLVYWAATPLFVFAYLGACHLVLERPPTWMAALVAAVVWLPFPALRAVYILPAIAWLAFIGLSVPASLVEGLSFRDALVRGRRLGIADYAHALGSLAALVIVVGVAEDALSALLTSQSDTDLRIALALSDLILSPLLFIGGALLYLDQAARVGSSRPTRRRRRDADLHPPLDADPAGRADAQVEP